MFVDFNKVFSKDTPANVTIPNALVEYLNKSLPEGVKYTATPNGECEIIGDGAEGYTLGGFLFKPDKETMKILGEKFTQIDVMNYSYNAQKPIELKLAKEGFVILNGKEFPVEKLKYNPMIPFKYKEGSFFAVPSKFPPAFDLVVGDGKYQKVFKVSRVPNESLTESAFESDENEAIIIKYFLDSKDHKFSMNISLKLKNAKTIRDVVESVRLYNSFIDGRAEISGIKLNPIKEAAAKRFDENSALFWEKLLQIEEELDVCFDPPQDDVDYETMCDVEQIYQNIVLKTPIRSREVINSIDGDWEIDKSEIENVKNRQLYFEFQSDFEISLFGVQKIVPAFVGVFNALVSNYSVNKKGKKKITLCDVDENHKRYVSVLAFKDEKEYDSFIKKPHDEIMRELADSKLASEYLPK